MDELPPELIEIIVDLLDFDDICALRVCCSALRSKASQGCFRTFLHPDKRLRLTDSGPKSLVAATRNEDSVGRNLRRLTLVGVCEAGTAGPGREGQAEQVDLLRAAFDSIKENTSSGRLELLSLGVEVHADGKFFVPTDAIGSRPWMAPVRPSASGRPTGPGYPKDKYGPTDAEAVWDASRRTFQVVLEALAPSSLVVDELRIFTDVLHCSLACDQLLFGDGANWPVFQQTRRLALSVSHSLRPSEHTDETSLDSQSCSEGGHSEKAKKQKKMHERQKSTGENNSKSIVRFLSAFPNLEHLDLQWYSMVEYRPSACGLAEQHFLSRVNASLHWPQLTSVVLVGLRTTTEPLQAFFDRHQQLTHIEMDGIHFPSNPSKQKHLTPLLKHFSRKGSKLEYLRLEEIWTSRQVVFGEDGESEWRGEKARQRIRARIYFLPPQGAGIEDFWELWERHRRYGPP